MRRAGEDGPREGVRIACELLLELRKLVRGAYLMPAFNRFDLVAEVIEQARVLPLPEPQPPPAATAGPGG
jgi:homocysteine S-methyltransferase